LISRTEILGQLDDAARRFTFPMLDNGYVYPVRAWMTAFRGDASWAVIIDVFGVSPRAGGIDAAHNCLHCFGNCLRGEPGVSNDSLLYVVDDGPDGPVLEMPYEETLAPTAGSVSIRGQPVSTPHDPATYASAGIDLVEPPAIYLFELMRWVAGEHAELLRTPEADLVARLAAPVPVFLRADEWHHPDLAAMEVPSEHGCFASLADALETGDPSRFDPGSPNTHWSHWPDGGSL